jgi:hypothetical protein
MLTKTATSIFAIVKGIGSSIVILSTVTQNLFATHSYITLQTLDLLHRLIPILTLVVAMNWSKSHVTLDIVRFKTTTVQSLNH